MPYRDEVEALSARVQTLERENDDLRARLERTSAALASVAGELAGLPFDADISWRSLHGGEPFELTLVNGTEQKLALSWVSYDGRERPEATLVPGGRLTLPTHSGHLWRAREGAVIVWQGYARAGEPELTIAPL